MFLPKINGHERLWPDPHRVCARVAAPPADPAVTLTVMYGSFPVVGFGVTQLINGRAQFTGQADTRLYDIPPEFQGLYYFLGPAKSGVTTLKIEAVRSAVVYVFWRNSQDTAALVANLAANAWSPVTFAGLSTMWNRAVLGQGYDAYSKALGDGHSVTIHTGASVGMTIAYRPGQPLLLTARSLPRCLIHCLTDDLTDLYRIPHHHH